MRITKMSSESPLIQGWVVNGWNLNFEFLETSIMTQWEKMLLQFDSFEFVPKLFWFRKKKKKFKCDKGAQETEN